MEKYRQELEMALDRIEERGLSRADYSFDMAYLEPDPDGADMFAVRYQVDIRNNRTGKNASLLGGAGLNWVERFDEAVADGYFD